MHFKAAFTVHTRQLFTASNIDLYVDQISTFISYLIKYILIYL